MSTASVSQLPVTVSIPSLAMNEAELIAVLESSLYPGAKPESIKLVVAYCRAAQLDPMLKPVHIVPMKVKQKKRDGNGFEWVWRDVVMPGIELYRIKADRTGQYVGLSEPEFGPEEKIGNVLYPKWCKIVAKRRMPSDGFVAEFPAKVYWLETYATAGRDDDGNTSTTPNRMWTKRPFGQIEKCAEALALRRAFPELGAQPTAEEMEGKTIDADVIEGTVTARSVEQPQLKHDSAPAAAATSANPPDAGAGSGGGAPEPFKPMIEGQKKMLKARLTNAKLTVVDLEAHFGKKLDAADQTGFAFSDYAALEKWISEHAKP